MELAKKFLYTFWDDLLCPHFYLINRLHTLCRNGKWVALKTHRSLSNHHTQVETLKPIFLFLCSETKCKESHKRGKMFSTWEVFNTQVHPSISCLSAWHKNKIQLHGSFPTHLIITTINIITCHFSSRTLLLVWHIKCSIALFSEWHRL
jgi:hypothetical protein